MCLRYEDDISAEEKTESQSSWFQSQNEYFGRKKSVSCQKKKRKSKIICLMNQAARDCGLFFYAQASKIRLPSVGGMGDARRAGEKSFSARLYTGQRRFHEKISFRKKEQRFSDRL